MSVTHPHVYAFEGVVPVIDPTAYVHPSAVLIGDVIVGPGCYIGACATMRGDFGRIELHRDSNLQDNCVVHSLSDFDCVMEERSHIGHGALVHGCRIGRETLVGMNAVVLDRAEVGEQTIIAALALVKERARVPARVLFAGIPGKVVRELTDIDLKWKRFGTDQYVELAQRSKQGLVRARALTSVEADRPRIHWDKPKF